jgi:hypothetical protein
MQGRPLHDQTPGTRRQVNLLELEGGNVEHGFMLLVFRVEVRRGMLVRLQQDSDALESAGLTHGPTRACCQTKVPRRSSR